MERQLFKKEKDNIENVKEQRQEIQTVLDGRVLINENHKCFEYNLKTNEIRLAKFEQESFEIHWFDALSLFTKKKNAFGEMSKIPKKTKAKIVRRENCVYLMSLNKQNALKILKRDFNLDITK